MSSPKPSPAEVSRFWQRQARRLGSFREAPSTGYYLEGEQRLVRTHMGPLGGLRVLKLDLWNEAKNTNILAWMAEQGATTFAIDVAQPLAVEAKAQFEGAGLTPRFAVADIYNLPFLGESFDAVYTMGTIEHAPEMDRCAAEIFRVLKPGGVAIVGVPNRRDPFLRPALVAGLDALGAYPYGFEQSLSHAGLERLLAGAGFDIVGRDGLLFMPGVLRMAELWALGRWQALVRVFGAAHEPFRWMARAWPGLNRHGYLIAAVVRKPGA
jgi:SAM-dependent methyltransferase